MNTAISNISNKINATLVRDYVQSNMQGFYFGTNVEFDKSTLEFLLLADKKPVVVFYGPYTNLDSGRYSIELNFSAGEDSNYEFYVYANACKYIIIHTFVSANQVNQITFEIDSLRIKKDSLEFVLVSNHEKKITIQLQEFRLNVIELNTAFKNDIPTTFFLSNESSVNIINNSITNIENAKILLGCEALITGDSYLEPSLEDITSQLCSASQFYSPIYSYWCNQIKETPRLHRKQWEFVYILQALKSFGMLDNGKLGLGFGCGKEPLPSLMATLGCQVLATDLDSNNASDKGWVSSSQHAAELSDLLFPKICEKETFDNQVSFKSVDMNHIPRDLNGFDFTWSACAFEHLGSINKGLDFVINSVKCLKPGGIAVHTTEFNLSSNHRTFESESCVFFRKRDLELLITKLEKMRCTVMPLNLTIGELVEDGFVDLPPYKSEPHIKLAMQGHITTSIGIIIKKNEVIKTLKIQNRIVNFLT